MNAFTQIATEAVGKYGYVGLFVALTLNMLGVPLASEVMLPLAGYAVHNGSLDLTTTAIVAYLAQVLGFVVAYLIASKNGLPLLESYGKYVFIRHRQIHALQNRLKRSGKDVEVVGLLVPGIHGYMGYLGGIGKMKASLFMPIMLMGTAVWTAALLALGYWAGEKLAVIGNYAQIVGELAVAGVVVAIAIWYSRRYWPNSRHQR